MVILYMQIIVSLNIESSSPIHSDRGLILRARNNCGGGGGGGVAKMAADWRDFPKGLWYWAGIQT